MRTAHPKQSVNARELLDHLPFGLVIYGPDGKLSAATGQFTGMLSLPDDFFKTVRNFSELATFMATRGDLGPGEVSVLARGFVATFSGNSEAGPIEARIGAQHVAFGSRPLPSGERMLYVTDITARTHMEAALERSRQSLEQRVRERTAALSRVNAELEQARAKADAANSDKTRFLAAASHDLLQPLNAARLYTATLGDRAAGTSFEGIARSIEGSLTAVEEIMSALLDISRMDSGALKPDISVFDIREMLGKTELEFRPQAREHGVDLRLVGATALVSTDRMLIGRVVQNLVSNAIKYTPAGGAVLVGIRQRGNRIRLDVIDRGIGINKDQQSLIFAEFARLEQAARIAPGLGLGLSIVQRIATALALNLEIDSNVDRGSRFSFYLQKAHARDLPRPDRTQPKPAIVRTPAGLKVLCIDNEREIVDAMQSLLQGWRCDVRTAQSLRDIGRDSLLDGWLPDFVLVDYHLDQTSGLDAIEWLRHNLGGHLAAALITADRDPRIRSMADERGIALLTKPVRPASLRALLGRSLPLGGKPDLAIY